MGCISTSCPVVDGLISTAQSFRVNSPYHIPDCILDPDRSFAGCSFGRKIVVAGHKTAVRTVVDHMIAGRMAAVVFRMGSIGRSRLDSCCTAKTC